MATPHLFFIFFVFTFLCTPHTITSSSCTLNFTNFPYKAHSDCLNNSPLSVPPSCCGSALRSLFQAMTTPTNHSQTLFLGQSEAQDCSVTFQNLHKNINFSECHLQEFVSSSNLCAASEVGSVIARVGGAERFGELRASCGELAASEYSDGACLGCVVRFREAVRVLRGGRDARGCEEALLVSLASLDAGSWSWVRGTFDCLWSEVELAWRESNTSKGHHLSSKEVIAMVIVAAAMVCMAPFLYKITRRQLQHASDKDIKDLSVTILKNSLDDGSTSTRSFKCQDLYIFSRNEIRKATNSFDKTYLVGEGTLGKVYVGVMPSGMKVAIKRLNEEIKLCDFIEQICQKAKIRYPNLVSIIGYCDKGDECLVYEFCANGHLADWLLGGQRMLLMSLTWEQRVEISIGAAKGLWFLHKNPLQTMAHGDVKLTNILLDEKLEAKISDSILSSKRLDKNTLNTTKRTDVYSFGVVLLQLLTGKKTISLVDEARRAKLEGGANFLADPSMNGAYVLSEFQHILSIAVLCTTPNEHERPDMEQVVQKLVGTRGDIA